MSRHGKAERAGNRINRSEADRGSGWPAQVAQRFDERHPASVREAGVAAFLPEDRRHRLPIVAVSGQARVSSSGASASAPPLRKPGGAPASAQSQEDKDMQLVLRRVMSYNSTLFSVMSSYMHWLCSAPVGRLIASPFHHAGLARLRRPPIRPKPTPMSARLPGSGTDAGELAGRKTVRPEFGSSR